MAGSYRKAKKRAAVRRTKKRRATRSRGSSALVGKMRRARPIVNNNTNQVGAPTMANVMKAVGMLVDPFNYLQYSQPRVLSAPTTPAYHASSSQICGKNQSSSFWPGCGNSWLLVFPSLSYDYTVGTVVGADYFAFSSSGAATAFVAFTTAGVNPVARSSHLTSEVADINLKAAAMKLRYNAPYAQASGRIFAGTLPANFTATSLNPANIINYQNVREYSMDELLTKEVQVWGTKCSVVANNFIAAGASPDDYNVPFFLITGFTKDAATGTTDSAFNMVLECMVTFDMRPAISTSGVQDIIQLGDNAPVDAGTFGEITNMVSSVSSWLGGSNPIQQGTMSRESYPQSTWIPGQTEYHKGGRINPAPNDAGWGALNAFAESARNMLFSSALGALGAVAFRPVRRYRQALL